ncbi:nucleotidyltransferase domain-containing protein [Candidatus Nanohalobium constans]|uniref:Nucleotidyltransferase domain-containing protein n=1 Tax=Candidatus Nanohalobium constans TaxID=2565781 RepID=A0A5Q0UFP9_9ARCH|nr:nucleotidyltransferase domain-containing protein [Candidatus Nanohalobium constans]QGA80364.1 nucleotidyltransferase domain-containing protein [Candidatus Nanohalobium constans]
MVLASEEDIKDFAEDVREEFGDRVEKILLYGSYARDEHVPGSDVDIAVLVSEKRDNDREKLFDIAEDYRWDKDIFFSPRVFELDKFKQKAEASPGFYSTVSKEGVEV